MRILDRQRYWAFFKAYVICFTSLVGLYVVIDAFSNFDEFTDRATGVELFGVMGRFYLVHMTEFFDRLCGVIGMMAAIFTVTWMQKNNELLAMLAAGVSTQRVIRPVIFSAVIVSCFSVINQELIMPPIADELLKSHADDGSKRVQVTGHSDENRLYLNGYEADRQSQTVFRFAVTIPVEVFGSLREVQALQATYVPADHPSAPLRGGWLLRGTKINAPMDEAQVERGVLVHLDSPAAGSDMVPDFMSFGILPTVKRVSWACFPPPFGEIADLGGETFFLRTGVTFKALTRKRQWYQFATTGELLRSLSDQSNNTEWGETRVFLHTRILRPLLSMGLLFMSLPLVLSGYGRNMFINLGLSLGTSALFYAAGFVCQYLGSHDVLSPEMSAWAPLIIFGTWASARWGRIRT
jgi:lipopolysaccharide export system permease protein